MLTDLRLYKVKCNNGETKEQFKRIRAENIEFKDEQALAIFFDEMSDHV